MATALWHRGSSRRKIRAAEEIKVSKIGRGREGFNQLPRKKMRLTAVHAEESMTAATKNGEQEEVEKGETVEVGVEEGEIVEFGSFPTFAHVRPTSGDGRGGGGGGHGGRAGGRTSTSKPHRHGQGGDGVAITDTSLDPLRVALAAARLILQRRRHPLRVHGVTPSIERRVHPGSGVTDSDGRVLPAGGSGISISISIVGGREPCSTALPSSCANSWGIEEREVEIERRLEAVLGGFRKQFHEGPAGAHRLGALFGGYGSFLLTQPARKGRPLNERRPVLSKTVPPAGGGDACRTALPSSCATAWCPEEREVEIERRLEAVLGGFRRQFHEGPTDAHRLGALFGGYGSFLLPQPARTRRSLNDQRPVLSKTAAPCM